MAPSSYVQILSKTCFLLFFDEKRYLFNCGEGIQRLCTQHAVRTTRLAAIFLTRLDWEAHSGGLPGLLCTLGDIPGGLISDELELIGPHNTSHFVGALRPFLRRPLFSLTIREYPENSDSPHKASTPESNRKFSDSNVSINDKNDISSNNLGSAYYNSISQSPRLVLMYKDDLVTVHALSITSDEVDQNLVNDPSQSKEDLGLMAIPKAVDPCKGLGGNTIKISETNTNDSKSHDENVVPVTKNEFVSRMFKFSDSACNSVLPRNRPRECESDLIIDPKNLDINLTADEVDSINDNIHDDGKIDFSVTIDQTDQHLNYEHSMKSNSETGREAQTKDKSIKRPKQDCISEDMRFNRRMPVLPRSPCQSVCYLVTGPSIPGKFDARAAKALGIPSGPLNGRLVKGETVQFVKSDGSVVTVNPDQCVGPSIPGNKFCILDVSSMDMIIPLSRQIKLLNQRHLVMVIHIISLTVSQSELYQKKIVGAFPPNVRHIMCFEKNMFPSIINLPSYELLASELPFHDFSSTNSDDTVLEKHVWSPSLLPIDIKDPSTCLNFHIVNNQHGIDMSKVRKLNDHSDAPQSIELNGNLPLKKNFSCPQFPVITFLGTGAAIPGKYRNVSSTLVEFGKDAGCILFDCGEGTFSQLQRKFSTDRLIEVLNSMRIIFISHLHADHQLGFLGLLKHLRYPICLVAPNRYQMFLEEYLECVDFANISDINFVATESLVFSNGTSGNTEEDDEIINVDQKKSYFTQNPFNSPDSDMMKIIRSFSVRAVPVIHCRSAYGYIVQYTPFDDKGTRIKNLKTSKIVFSGDTRPCPALIEAGHGCDVLIHEATFEAELLQEAIDRCHSTVDEALAVGSEMGASLILLTHFSQRYAKSLPLGPWNTINSRVNVIPAAVDLLSVETRYPEKAMATVQRFISLKENEDD